MRVNTVNVYTTDLVECLNYKAKIIGVSNGRGSHLFPDGYGKLGLQY